MKECVRKRNRWDAVLSLVFEQQLTEFAEPLEAAPTHEMVLPCISALLREKIGRR